MLLLGIPVLAIVLGQSCPTPSPYDPPPCAAARVPGCLPGYRPQWDRSGRLFYVCNGPAAQPVAVPVQAAPPMPTSMTATDPPAVSATPVTPTESRGHVGLVLMPGFAAFPASERGFHTSKPEAQIALEFRGTEGGARVRLVGEWASFGRIGELSFKYNFFDEFFFRPWLAIGVGIASINPDASVRAAGSASAGVDLFISRDFFLTGELKGRAFMSGTNGPAHGLAISDWRQVSLLAGMGFYFF